MSIIKRTIQIIAVVAVISTFFGLILYHLGHIPNAAAADSPQVASDSKAETVTEYDLFNLGVERKEVLLTIVETMEKQYKQGIADAEQLRQAKINFSLADLDWVKPSKERIKIRKQIVLLYQEAESELTSRVTAGRANALDLEKAKVARLTAEIELVKEQQAAAKK
jgi:hypothetical protein